MGATLTRRDCSLKLWQMGLLALVLAIAVGMLRPGASWGDSAYNAASDPYSMQNITAGDGAQAWWNAGDTGQGVDVAAHRHGRCSRAGAERRRQDRERPRPLVRVPGSVDRVPRHERPRHVHGGDHRRQRRPVRRLSRRRSRLADPLGEGRCRQRRRRRQPGDRGGRLGRPASLRQRDEHPGHQSLVRHGLASAVYGRSACLRGRAGVEGRHRRGHRRGEHRQRNGSCGSRRTTPG